MSEDKEEELLREAYGRLRDTIAEIVALEGVDVSEAMVTDWVTVAAVQGYDEDGEPYSGTITVVPPTLGSYGGIPRYRVVGLLDVALTEARHPTVAPHEGEYEE